MNNNCNKKRKILISSIIMGISIITLCSNPLNGNQINVSAMATSSPVSEVIPSGEVIGVKIESEGVLVVGLTNVLDENNNKISPSADAGVEIGDIIISINGCPINKEADIVNILSKCKKGDTVDIELKRNKKTVHCEVKPVISENNTTVKIGMWVRDNISGIGTMTFMEPISGKFGALGHGITDMDTGKLINIDTGIIVQTTVSSVVKAKASSPGELVGSFQNIRERYGVVHKNTDFGIYGVVNNRNSDKSAAIPVATINEIKEGPAKIISTVDGNGKKEYDILIQKVNRQKTADSKSMIIEVVDPELLAITGGIVQGMSGSPIIQDGKFVGAVTHVLINNPTKGYAISAEWMINELQY